MTDFAYHFGYLQHAVEQTVEDLKALSNPDLDIPEHLQDIIRSTWGRLYDAYKTTWEATL